MSAATIYIKSNGDDDLTIEQLELLHRYSDQARVWAHLLLTEAGLIETTEEWRQRRDEWVNLKNELIALNEAYGAAVTKALQQQYQAKKLITETPLPPAEDFFPADSPPEKLKEAALLAEKIKKDFAELYPSRIEVGYSGPFLTDEEKEDLFNPPDIRGLPKEEAEKKMKDWEEKAGLDLQKWTQSGRSPILDLVKGYAINHGTQIIDPDTGATIYSPSSRTFNEDLMEDFASEVLVRAIKSYNPFKSEDTGVGHEGKKASFGTYLFRAMVNEIKSRKEKYARNLGIKDVLPAEADVPYILNQLIRQLKISPEELKSKIEEAGLTEASPIEDWRNFYNQFQTEKKFKVVKVPYSLSQPTGDDESLTIEETIAEKGAAADSSLWNDLLEPLRVKLYERVNAPDSKFSPESAERMVDIFKRMFIDHQRMSSVAKDLGLIVDRPRAKEIAVMKQLGIDVSTLPATIPPEKSVSQDREDRQRLFTNFFAGLINRINTLAKQSQTPEVAKQLASAQEAYKKAKEKFDSLSQPDAGRIHNLLWGDPRRASAPSIMPILMELSPEVKELVESTSKLRKKQALEDFLTSISRLRVEGSLNYNLLRNKIQQKLARENPQLFTVYTYLYESDYSNPDTARMMRLSPPRITGLKKKIISTLLDLPEIQSFLHESDYDSISPLRRYIYNEGDAVRVTSINEPGNIENISTDNWFKIRLHNGNEVFTIKEDIQKHSTLVDSARNVLNHYFDREVVTPQCYLSFISSASPQLVILELRPSSEIKTVARLHINNNLIEITEFTEKYPDNLISILKGHLGTSTAMETPFTPLFEEVE